VKRWFISIIVSAGLLLWLFSGLDEGDVRSSFTGLHWKPAGTALLFYLAGLLFRAWRYRMLLNTPVSFGTMIQVTAVRNMFADLLPARAGTAVYVYLVVRRFGVGLGDALSSFFAVFLLDLASLAPILGVGLLSLTDAAEGATPLALALPALLLLVASAAALHLLGPLLSAARKLAGRRGWREKARHVLERTGQEYADLRRRRILLPAFGVSLGVRLMKYLSWYFLLVAVLRGIPGAPSVPFGRALVGTIGAELSSTLPVSGIGGFGTYETAWSLSFGALGFTRELAVVTGFATHVLSQVMDYGIGVLALLWIYRPRLAGKAARFGAATAAVALLSTSALGAQRLWVRIFPPQVRSEQPGPEREAFKRAADIIGRRARIVWSSNRGGNHEIYLLELPGGDLRQLTDDPGVDYYSRFSPDGGKILFLRSRREWVSFRDSESWDVMLMDREGRVQRTLAEESYHPSWWPDGKSVVYTSGGSLVRHRLDSGTTDILADSGLEPFNGWFGTPYVSPDGGRVALTIRGKWRGVGVWDLKDGSLRRLDRADGCQLAWGPDGSLVWVSGGGRGKNRFLHLPAGAAEPAPFLDLPGGFSHEYFPRFSNDGRFLIFAASARGHEHDRADYEIFLWRVGTPPEEAVRLTHHGGNDQWPDIWVEPER
jgi:Tol biopolymer transport system component/uncharacterized membrane protein YbhN (UPF0104 family)